MKKILLILLPLVALGCASEGDMSKSDESTLKNNMTRGLTKEEMAQMGSSKTKAPNDKL